MYFFLQSFEQIVNFTIMHWKLTAAFAVVAVGISLVVMVFNFFCYLLGLFKAEKSPKREYIP